MKKISLICGKCNDKCGPFIITSHKERPDFGRCPTCKASIWKIDAQNTIYRNFQKMTIQEPPNKVEPGRIPRQREIIVLNDLIDAAKPGDEVFIVGELKAR